MSMLLQFPTKEIVALYGSEMQPCALVCTSLCELEGASNETHIASPAWSKGLFLVPEHPISDSSAYSCAVMHIRSSGIWRYA